MSSCYPMLLDERLLRLEDLARSSAGSTQPLVCRVCDAVKPDLPGETCLCGAEDYQLLSIVLAEVALEIDRQLVFRVANAAA